VAQYTQGCDLNALGVAIASIQAVCDAAVAGACGVAFDTWLGDGSGSSNPIDAASGCGTFCAVETATNAEGGCFGFINGVWASLQASGCNYIDLDLVAGEYACQNQVDTISGIELGSAAYSILPLSFDPAKVFQFCTVTGDDTFGNGGDSGWSADVEVDLYNSFPTNSGGYNCDFNECAADPCGAGGMCEDAVYPSTGYTCVCTDGYVESGGTCVDIDGCADDPCGIASGFADSCSDVAAPGTGHTCACAEGYLEFEGSCVTDYCFNVDCGTGSLSCASDNGNTDTYVCSCDTGYEAAPGAVCSEIDGCAGVDCGFNFPCVDVAAPGTGYTCDCGVDSGYFDNNGACELYNTCNGNTCGEGTCTPVNEQAYTCNCNDGYESDEDPNTPSCVNVDGCIGVSCGNGVCVDVPAPGTGYTCDCDDGYFDNDGTCSNIDGCADSSLCENGQCVDVSPPGVGHTCDCDLGYENLDNQTCVEIDGCAGITPCGTGSCVDVAAPGTGYTCDCNEGEFFDGNTCDYDCFSGVWEIPGLGTAEFSSGNEEYCVTALGETNCGAFSIEESEEADAMITISGVGCEFYDFYLTIAYVEGTAGTEPCTLELADGPRTCDGDWATLSALLSTVACASDATCQCDCFYVPPEPEELDPGSLVQPAVAGAVVLTSVVF
jgi:hypothetical protein